MSPPNLPPTGIPFNALFGVSTKQHPDYTHGSLGALRDIKNADPEWILREVIHDAIGGQPLQNPSPGLFIQHFPKHGRLGVTNGTMYYSNFFNNIPNIVKNDLATQGRFDLLLNKTGPNSWDLEIIVKWKMNQEGGLTLSQSALVQIIDRTNIVIDQVWGGYSLEFNNLIITIKPKVVKVNNGEFFNIHLYPDSADLAATRKEYPGDSEDTMGEVVNTENFRWQMYETHSFSDVAAPEAIKKGRGPHEFGHMIGIPHDYDVSNSIMYDKGPPFIFRMGQAGCNARPSYFKIAKLWVEQVLQTHLNNHNIDFLIKPPSNYPRFQ